MKRKGTEKMSGNTSIASQAQGIGKKDRCFYLDFLRAIACLSVVMIHVSAYYFKQNTGWNSWLGGFCNSISRVGVPLFVMISGALMLDENYAFSWKKCRGHVLKMLVFFVFWSFAYCMGVEVLRNLLQHEKISVSNILWALLKGQGHLWFVPMICALYLLVPLLRLWIKRVNRRYVEYFLLLSAVFAFALPQCVNLLSYVRPGFGQFNEILDNLNMKYPTGFTSYFVLGWYLNNYELPRKKIVYIMGIASGLLTFLGTSDILALTNAYHYLFNDNFTLNVALYATAIFTLAKSAFGRKKQPSQRLQRNVETLCKHSLGVYAVHVGLLSPLFKLFQQVHVLIALPLVFVCCTLASILLSCMLHKIPLLRRFV